MEGAPPGRRGPSQRPGARADDDLRGLRRWVIVACVWAVAATAVALIALLDTSDSRAEKDAEAAAERVVEAERALARRLDALEARLGGLPRSEDVSKLQERLSRAEQSASDAAARSEGAGRRIGELEDRVRQLAEDPPNRGPGDRERP